MAWRATLKIAVNPNADAVEGDAYFHDLSSVLGRIDGVVIDTRPSHAEDTMRECAELGIRCHRVIRAVVTLTGKAPSRV